MLDGVRDGAYCEGVGWAMLVLVFIQTCGAFFVRPFMTPYEALFHMLLSGLTCGSATTGVIGQFADSDVLIELSVHLAVGVGVVATMKSVLDLLFLLRWFYSRYKRIMRLAAARDENVKRAADAVGGEDLSANDGVRLGCEVRTDAEESFVSDKMLIRVIDGVKEVFLIITCQRPNESVATPAEVNSGGVCQNKRWTHDVLDGEELRGVLELPPVVEDEEVDKTTRAPPSFCDSSPHRESDVSSETPPPNQMNPWTVVQPAQRRSHISVRPSTNVSFSSTIRRTPRQLQQAVDDSLVVMPEYVQHERLSQLVLHICKRQLKKKASDSSFFL